MWSLLEQARACSSRLHIHQLSPTPPPIVTYTSTIYMFVLQVNLLISVPLEGSPSRDFMVKELYYLLLKDIHLACSCSLATNVVLLAPSSASSGARRTCYCALHHVSVFFLISSLICLCLFRLEQALACSSRLHIHQLSPTPPPIVTYTSTIYMFVLQVNLLISVPLEGSPSRDFMVKELYYLLLKDIHLACSCSLATNV